jgi:uncharacterized membrane protein
MAVALTCSLPDPWQGGLKLSPAIIVIAGGVVVLSVITWQTPGILASLILLILGFWRGHQLVLGLAVAFQPFYRRFYYNLG